MPPALVLTLPPRLALFSPGNTGYTRSSRPRRRVELFERDTGLHDRYVVLGVELEDLVHPLEAHEDAAVAGIAAPDNPVPLPRAVIGMALASAKRSTSATSAVDPTRTMACGATRRRVEGLVVAVVVAGVRARGHVGSADDVAERLDHVRHGPALRVPGARDGLDTKLRIMPSLRPLVHLTPDMPILVGGDHFVQVDAALAAAFVPGDRLLVVDRTGDLLHIPATAHDIAAGAVGRAADAFAQMGAVDDEQISAFFTAFAELLADPTAFAGIAEANRADMVAAGAAGRSTTRLELTDKMRDDMIDGLRGWAAAPSGRGEVIDRVEHEGWTLELQRAGLGVVGFVFEGRPNVFADACGVIRSGNTVVFRIGSDALGTARAIVALALDPALRAAGLPDGAATLVDSPSRATGWAMFSDERLALAVARGSGTAVTQLGSVARQAGVPVSLHGTGGAWIVAGATVDAEWLAQSVRHSLDRKVCNTLNTCCIVAERADELVPVFLDALQSAADSRGTSPKLHVAEGSQSHVPDSWHGVAGIARASGVVEEAMWETIPVEELGVEWEWEDSPEVSLVVVPTVDHAVALFNTLSPRFVASLVSSDPAEHDRFYEAIDAPFVGEAFTRWVDGQYAFGKPELGLSNWQFGRLFARGAVLSGDSVFTLRTRVRHSDASVHR